MSENSIRDDAELSMSDLLGENASPAIHRHQTVVGTIVNATETGWFVDIGLKSEGFLAKEEGDPSLQVGQKIEVLILKTGEQPLLSYRRVMLDNWWNKLKNAQQQKEPVEAIVQEKNKGGYSVAIGPIRGFLPKSQVGKNFLDRPEFIGSTIKVLVIEIHPKKDLVVSQRKYLEQEKKAKQEKFFANLKIGDIVEGRVVSLTRFGAFIDLEAIEALLPISEMSWQKVGRAEDILKVNDVVRAKVIKIIPEEKKVSLSLKELLPNPWENIESKYPVGSVVQGRINAITNFGVFVELEPGLEGLLHSNEVNWETNSPDLKNIFKIGEIIKCQILSTDQQKKKISLSRKALLPNPWANIETKYPAGAKVEGKIAQILPFGLSVELEPNLYGVLNVGDISWFKKTFNLNNNFKVGDKIAAVVIKVSPAKKQIILSHKHLTENPFEKYRVGTVVKFRVNKVNPSSASGEIAPGVEAVLKRNEYSRQKIEDLAKAIKPGDELEAKVTISDESSRRIEVSVKRLEMQREKELLKKYSAPVKPSLGEILQEK